MGPDPPGVNPAGAEPAARSGPLLFLCKSSNVKHDPIGSPSVLPTRPINYWKEIRSITTDPSVMRALPLKIAVPVRVLKVAS